LVAILTTSLVWLEPLAQGNLLRLELIQMNISTAALAGLFWLAVELFCQRRWNSVFDLHAGLPPIHRVCAIVSLGFAWIVVIACMVDKTFALQFGLSRPLLVGSVEGAMMIGSLSLLLVARLWDRTATRAVPALFAYGLMPVAVFLDPFDLVPRDLLFAVGCATSAYLFTVALLWWKREPICEIAQRSGVPTTTIDVSQIIRWLQPACVSMGLVSLAIGTVSVLTLPNIWQRLAAAGAGLLLVPAIALLGDSRRTFEMRYLSLLVAAAAAAQLGWAVMPVSGVEMLTLLRSIRFLSIAAVTTFIYAVVLIRFVSNLRGWISPVRSAAATLAGVSILSLSAVLLQEAALYQPGGVRLGIAQISVVAGVLVALAAALVSMAVLPGADPLRLADRGRILYVYAAEGVAALLFVHLRLTIPRLFSEFLRPYWPVIVIAIAFAGIGAGELFRRRRLQVLAEPLERTGAFLPLLPALGFWVVASEMNYSSTLFLIGLMYVAAAMLRRSFFYGAAAALAGNAALWALLSEQGLTIFSHPQMWFIPPALSVLIAGHINRRHLSESQLTSLRYLCVTVIYVSSSGEMFLKGVGENLWLPMVLACLSVAGVFGGIVLRVRAFLYLGSSFLLLSIVSMVWHAARRIDHVWPWWAFGIVLGLAILTLFGMFEKKRNEALRLVNDIRSWER
jgi:hypothetical protein